MTTAIGHNGGPQLDEELGPRPIAKCTGCSRWSPPAAGWVREYERFQLGRSRPRRARPTGYCTQIAWATRGPYCCATNGDYGCKNFRAKEPT